MPDDIGPCRNCGHTVERSATRCRACGYETDPKWNEMMQFVLGVYGGLLVGTVVLAPVGVVLLWKARLHHRALTRGLVECDEDLELRERVVTALAVTPAPEEGGDAPTPAIRDTGPRS